MAEWAPPAIAMRYAIYWSPSEDDPLLCAGEAWLGRRVGGESIAQPALDALSAERFAAVTQSARRYGFHATLAPPIALADGLAETHFMGAAHGLAQGLVPVPMPRLAVARLAGFIALRPVEDDAPLRAIAGRAVAAVDALRRPPTADELKRRAEYPLDDRERALLARWGYPYVFDAYRFHVTLSDRIAAESEALIAAAERHFAEALARPRLLDALAVFTEPEPEAPFRLSRRIPFGSRA